jgi:glyceraldehyde-3-phosphate dehydrogenase/erythrose-4-phosphate dehydrogenase
MTIKIGINGFGRIGRNVFKLLLKTPILKLSGLMILPTQKPWHTCLK